VKHKRKKPRNGGCLCCKPSKLAANRHSDRAKGKRDFEAEVRREIQRFESDLRDLA
jgi:hypothetical protein